MKGIFSPEQAATIIELFRAGQTVNEIAERVQQDAHQILLFLTAKGFWSEYCSGCEIKRCYDCKGLAELGKPISIQDRIDIIARLRELS